MARLRSAIPDIQYVIVGEGCLKSRLSELAHALRIEDAVQFQGALSEHDLGAQYRAADVFVLPSAKEGFGIVFLEAWNHGLPVICGAADASAEVVAHGESGLTVPPDDVDALAEAIKQILTNPDLARRLANAGREALRERYASDVFRRSVRALARDLCAMPAP